MRLVISHEYTCIYEGGHVQSDNAQLARSGVEFCFMTVALTCTLVCL